MDFLVISISYRPNTDTAVLYFPELVVENINFFTQTIIPDTINYSLLIQSRYENICKLTIRIAQIWNMHDIFNLNENNKKNLIYHV